MNHNSPKPTWNPLSEKRLMDADILSGILGRPVVIRKFNQRAIYRALKAGTVEAFLTHGRDLLIKCAHRQLDYGRAKLEDHGVYLSFEETFAAVYSLCWRPAKTLAGKRQFSDYDPMRMSVPVWVRKCVMAAIAELVHGTSKTLQVDGKHVWISLPTTSYEVLVETDYDPRDPAADFRDAIRFDDEPAESMAAID